MLKNIPLLDENNNIVGETTIPEAYSKGYWRRGVRVFLFNERGEMLLQQRSSTLESHAGFWTESAGGHVDIDESDIEAACREAQEELGTAVNLTAVEYGLRSTIQDDKSFCTVYTGYLPSDTKIILNTNEVAQVRWISVADLDIAIKNDLYDFVPSFVEVWQLCCDKILAA